MTLAGSTAPVRARPPSGRLSEIAPGSFEGYASLFGAEDQGGDIVMPGAFRTSLARRGMAEIRMLFQHDPAQPIGTWQVIREDARGLYVRGHVVEEVVRAREILALMRQGALDGLSIGFRTRKAIRDARTGRRRLYEIDLWEISVVTFPMLPGARVSAVKAATPARQNALASGSCASMLRGSSGFSQPALSPARREATPGGGLSIGSPPR